MKSISNKAQKAVRSNVQELDSFFWLLKLYYIVCKLFETMSMIRNDDDSLFHLLRNHHLQKDIEALSKLLQGSSKMIIE